MEDDGPDFSYAYGSTADGSANWNPALRPTSPPAPVQQKPGHPSISRTLDNATPPTPFDGFLVTPGVEAAVDFLGHPEDIGKYEGAEDDDFFDRYGQNQGATAPRQDHIAQHSAAPVQTSTVIDQSTTASSSRPADATSSRQEVQPSQHTRQPVQDAFANEHDNTVAVPPQELTEPLNFSGTQTHNTEPPLLPEEEDVGRVPAENDLDMHATGAEAVEQLHPGVERIDGPVEEHVPEENYEFQGESTQLEEAQEDDAAAPLISDVTTPAPVADSLDTDTAWGETPGEGADFSFDGLATHTSQPQLQEMEPMTPFEVGGEPAQPAVPSPPASLFEENEAFAREVETFNRQSESTVLSNPEPSFDFGQDEGQDFEFGQKGTEAFDVGTQENANTDTKAIEPEASEAPADLDAAWGAAFEDDDFLPEDVAADAFNFGDDEGFLDDLSAANTFLEQNVTPMTEAVPVVPAKSASRYAPAGATVPSASTATTRAPASQYLPTTTPFTSLSQPTQPQQTSQQSALGTPSPYSAAFGATPQRPNLTTSAASFADKARTGYASPYDLPEEIAKPRRRPVAQQAASPMAPAVQPPPRSSSMLQAGSVAPPTGPQRPVSSFAPNAGIIPMQSPASAPGQAGTAPTSNRVERKNSADFFAELPVAPPKPRAQTPMGKYAPQSTSQSQNLPQMPLRAPSSYAPGPTAQIPPPSNVVQGAAMGLRAPDRMMPYAEEPSNQSMPLPQAPPISRYSPAVPQANGQPPAGHGVNRYSQAPPPAPPVASRYSPAPPRIPAQAGPTAAYPSEISPPPSRSAVQPFAPRTSSPLAYSSTPTQVQPVHQNEMNPAPSQVMDAGNTGAMFDQSTSHAQVPSQPPPMANSPYAPREATPPGDAASGTNSPKKTSSYLPGAVKLPTRSITEPGMAPPPRSYTSSPATSLKQPKLAQVAERSVSAYITPVQTQQTPMVTQMPGENIIQAPPARQSIAPNAAFVMPQDERMHDPLQRWKGAPILRWGSGGQIVSSFPTHVPRYGMSAAGPMIKCMQDDYKVRNIKEVYPLSDAFLKFPGPLKKGKKKDVLTWLRAYVDNLEKTLPSMHLGGPAPTLDIRSEEKLMLWRIMTLFIEHDGQLEGSPVIEAAARQILGASLPSTEPMSAEPLSAVPQSTLSEAQGHPNVLGTLRDFLIAGDREKAVWHAVDQRLWAHSFLIASTLSKDIWKQVVQEFVRKEIRKAGDNTESLAALYQVFAGNWEESIDELVSVSARAGFQMVNTEGSSQRDALAGLAKWRETLLLILSNRSTGDAQALLSLGKLLRNYDRIEAAHICFLFARSTVRLSGADDPQADLVLLGEDPATHGSDFGKDLESVLLTEVLEFGLTLGSSPVTSMPHLQVYKLYHAEVLAESAQKSEAQSYCDAVTSIVHGKTNRSPYYNLFLMQRLDELSKRLSQANIDNSSSWKPSMDKVSASLLNRFTSFVAGDDNKDAQNTASPPSDSDNFVRMKGDTPDISRQASNTDLYSAMNGTMPIPAVAPPTGAASRYAPGGAYSPRTSLDQPRSASAYQPRASQEAIRAPYDPHLRTASPPQRAASYNPAYTPQSYTPSSQGRQSLEGARPASASTFSPPSSSYQGYTPAQPSYEPEPIIAQETTPQPEAPASLQPAFGYEQPAAQPPADDEVADDSSQSHRPSFQPYEPQSFDPPPQEEGDTPPTFTSFEPPSYQPYEPVVDPEPESPAEDKPKPKKSYMDDDDDDELFRRAAALKSSKKSDADRATDEAFRKAAEADGMYSSINPAQFCILINAHSCPRRSSRRLRKTRLLVRRLVQRQRRRRHAHSTIRTHQSQARRDQSVRF